MVNKGKTKGLFFAGILIFSGITAYSQNDACKVRMLSISGIYTGECKKSLAHGQGTSQGIDTYTGGFREGLPDGTGTYKWADGSIYEGHWNRGMKDGGGKMVTRDSTYTGFWKEDKYIGKEIIPPYRITHSYNIIKSSFSKSKSTNEVIRIRFYQGAVEYGGIKSVDIAYNSGVLFRDGNIHGVQDPKYPIEIRIHFTTTDRFGTGQFDADLDFTISEPGAWDVRIYY
jgi:hypothetical protein